MTAAPIPSASPVTPSAAVIERAAPCSAIASLYKTTGPRTKDHVLVFYLAADKDWTARNFERNGNHWPALANVPMTPAAWDYRNSSARATSLRYSGKAPQDESGFVEDMRSLGFDEQTVEMLATAARPYWPNAEVSEPGDRNAANATGAQPPGSLH